MQLSWSDEELTDTQVRRVASELGMTPEEVDAALFEPVLEHIDRTVAASVLGPARLRVAASTQASAEHVRTRLHRGMLRRQLEASGDVWVQRGERWPDPSSGVTITRIRTVVEPGRRTTVMVDADLSEARFTYAFSIAGFATMPLLTAGASPWWPLGAAVGTAATVAWFVGARRSYARRLDVVARALRELLTEVTAT